MIDLPLFPASADSESCRSRKFLTMIILLRPETKSLFRTFLLFIDILVYCT